MACKKETTKTCPYCLSTIPLEACKCAFCTSDLREDDENKDKAQIKESDLVTSSYGISQSINSKTSKPMTIQKSENFNLPDIKVGDTVQHKLFGTGTVSKIDKAQKYIYVRFDKGEKMFVFDYVFKNGLLTLT